MIIESINTERALSPTGIELADYVINPYTGCQFGCVYCYAKSNKNVSRIKYRWGDFVFVKQNMPELLEKEIREKKDKISKVLIGSTTDPFQPAESRYGITRAVIKTLREHNISVVILTRSPLVDEYLELLEYSEDNTIYFTYNPAVAGLFAKNRLYPNEKILDIIENISNRNIKLVVYVGPVFPGITDAENILSDLRDKVKDVHFENYNFKMGSWDEIKNQMDKKLVDENRTIVENEEEYKNYWDRFIKETDDLNERYGYNIKYFIHPFDAYYRPVI